MAPMTGFSIDSMRLSAACDSPTKCRKRARSGPPFAPDDAPVSPVSDLKSIPAEKTSPSPYKITARTSARLTSISARGSASSIAPLTALRFSGRLSARYASSPSILILTSSSGIARGSSSSGFDQYFKCAFGARIENLVAIGRFIERKRMADDWTGIDFGVLDEFGEMRDVAADIREPGAEGQVLHERLHHRKTDRRIAYHTHHRERATAAHRLKGGFEGGDVADRFDRDIGPASLRVIQEGVLRVFNFHCARADLTRQFEAVGKGIDRDDFGGSEKLRRNDRTKPHRPTPENCHRIARADVAVERAEISGRQYVGQEYRGLI